MGQHRAHRGDRRATSASRQVSASPASSSYTGGGKRRATPAPSRGSLVPGLPSAPVVAGVAALAISAGGALTATTPALVAASADAKTGASTQAGASQPAASTSVASLIQNRRDVVSRDSRRVAETEQQEQVLQNTVELQAVQREADLKQVAEDAEAQNEKIEANRWVLPVTGYRLTGRFAQSSGLWSSTHTGLDFAVGYGTPIRAMANGTITQTSYEGAYGNRTVLTTDDGTELWFCHQATFNVSAGERVNAGDVIGYVGMTGNTTGPHVHLEVRPGGGNPIDPYAAMVAQGLDP